MQVSNLVKKAGQHVKPGARVLDLACGGGRNGRFFLNGQMHVTFLDQKIEGVADLAAHPGAALMRCDLEKDGAWPLYGKKYDAVIVINYLWRPNMDRILDLVSPGGVLIYETFARGNEAYGRPSNPDFLLRENELIDNCRGRFEILYFQAGLETDPAPAIKQKIIARRCPGV